MLACGLALLIGCTKPAEQNQAAADAAISQKAAEASAQSISDAESLTNGESRLPNRASRPQSAPTNTQTSPTENPSSPATDATTKEVISAPRRMANDQPELNEARLQAVGIDRYESRRLVLLTDLPAERVAGLPALADQLFERLERHFGPLPPALDGSDFQITGCIISDVKRFQSAGLMPAESFTFSHGRHLNYQFWCYSQKSDYYLRHLALHEFTHCFMTCESGLINIPPLWYIEGMAEYFATHQIAKAGAATFGILPASFAGYEGWGRISELNRVFPRGQTNTKPGPQPSATFTIPPLNKVLRDVALQASDTDYALWWAACWMLQTNPRYANTFAALKPLRTRNEFITKVHELRETHDDVLQADWLLFAESLDTGFDPAHGFPVHAKLHQTLSSAEASTAKCTIVADAEWQDSGVRLQAGQVVRLVCEGQFSVNQPAESWASEPQGVGVEYYRGIPLGAVVATLVDDNGIGMTKRMVVGREGTITATNDATLWLQINDASSSRSDNAGEVDVSIALQSK